MSLYETRSRSILDALDVPRDMSVHASPTMGDGSVVTMCWGEQESAEVEGGLLLAELRALCRDGCGGDESYNHLRGWAARHADAEADQDADEHRGAR